MGHVCDDPYRRRISMRHVCNDCQVFQHLKIGTLEYGRQLEIFRQVLPLYLRPKTKKSL